MAFSALAFAQTPGSVPVATADIPLAWSAPTQRENGATLPASEIAGYEIRYRKPTDNAYSYATLGPTALNYSLKGAAKDSMEIGIAVFDTNGLYSNFLRMDYVAPSPPKQPSNFRALPVTFPKPATTTTK